MTIADSKLRQSVWETFYDALASATFSTSPTPKIVAAYIDGDRAPFPQIVISPVEVTKDSFVLGEDRKSNTKNISLNIDIYTKKNKDLDVLSDEVDEALTIHFNGLTLVSFSEFEGQLFPNEQKLRVKTLSYNFIRR